MQHSYVLHWWRIVCHVNIFSEILYKSLLFFNVHKVCANVLKYLGHFERFSSRLPFNTKCIIISARRKPEGDVRSVVYMCACVHVCICPQLILHTTGPIMLIFILCTFMTVCLRTSRGWSDSQFLKNLFYYTISCKPIVKFRLSAVLAILQYTLWQGISSNPLG